MVKLVLIVVVMHMMRIISSLIRNPTPPDYIVIQSRPLCQLLLRLPVLRSRLLLPGRGVTTQGNGKTQLSQPKG